MAEKFVRIGSLDNIHVFDDGDFTGGVETDDTIKAGLAPVANEDVLRLVDIGGVVGNVVLATANIADHTIVRGHGGLKVIQDSGITIDDNDNIALPGNLTFTAAGDGLQYGSLYLHEGAVNIDISTPGQGVYVKITGLTAGLMNGVSENSDAFNVAALGVYLVNWSISGDSQGINKDYHCDIFINGVEQGDGSARMAFGGAHDLGSMAGTAILDITNAAHDIDLRIKEEGAGAGTDIDLYHVNFNIVQIGGT